MSMNLKKYATEDFVNSQLSNAKESGEFDGKSAYQYAKEGGYTGTEADFAERMAADIPAVDSTLTKSGQAADAAAVGNRLSLLSEEIANLPSGGSGLTTEQINALDGMFKVCAFTKDNVSAEYTAFKTAFGIADSGGETEVTLTSISAVYGGGEVAVGTAVTDLTGIVVTAHYSDGSTETVTGYTLSGTIAEGSNTITVTYQGKTATFTVTGVAESGGEVASDTTVQIETYDTGLRNNGNTVKAEGLGVTKVYEFTTVRENLPTRYEYLIGMCPYTTETVGSSNAYAHLYIDGVFQTIGTFYGSGKPLTNTQTEGKMSINTDDGAYNGVRFPIAYANVDDAYLYVQSTGQVLFAGKNTPYYGMSNIDGTLA